MLLKSRAWVCLRACYYGRQPIITKSDVNNVPLFAAKSEVQSFIHSFRESAHSLFEERPKPTVQQWNSMVKRSCREKKFQQTLLLFSNMLRFVGPESFTVSIALKACCELGVLSFGRAIHGRVKKNDELSSNLFIGSRLIQFYSKCGNTQDALRIFEEFTERDVVLWTAMISGYEQNDQHGEALKFFSRMLTENAVDVDPITLISVLSACAQLLDLKAGKSVHGVALRRGLCYGLSLLNALLNLYGKARCVTAVNYLFGNMEERDVISWTSIISCHAHNGAPNEALNLFHKMIRERIQPNSVSLISALQACEATCDLDWGKRIHGMAIVTGLVLDVLVSTALIDMYMNCSSPNEAIQVFERMAERDFVSWSALLAGCAQNGIGEKSLKVFCSMIAANKRPGADSVVKVLTSCAESGILQQTSCFHGYAVKGGFDYNCYVGAALLDSYAKCGSLDDAVQIFGGIADKDNVIWSSMFSGYGIHGRAQESLRLFDQMIKSSSVRPSAVTFISILSACSHSGLVEEGIRLFNLMLNHYQIHPQPKHYILMVDLLGRIGDLDKAVYLINQMPAGVQSHVWGALLAACRIHQNVEIGQVASNNLSQLNGNHAGYHILLSHIYAADRKWDAATSIRNSVNEKDLYKKPGQSAIDLRNEVHEFVANDQYHPESRQIYAELRKLEVNLRATSRVSDEDFLAAGC